MISLAVNLTLSRTKRIGFISILLIMTAACQMKMPFTNQGIAIDDLTLDDPTKHNQAINEAITLLENGETDKAKNIITQVLKSNPKHETALLLRKQLSLPANRLFSTKRTTRYKIKSGDTLGSIAKTWLENPIYFVTLARLNKIANPSKIQPGTFLIIPVIATSPLVKKERFRSRANIDLLGKYIEQKKYLKSLERMTSIFIINSHREELRQLQYDTLITLASAQASISGRHRMIDQIKVISAKSKRKFLDENFHHFIQLQLHNVLLDEFLLLFEDESYHQAASKIIEAKKLAPIIKQNISVLEIEKELIDKLHEEAIILRKNQQLDAALTSWNLILELQPDNSLAQRYLERTKKLLNRLKKLQ